jgi:YfiH family protein
LSVHFFYIRDDFVCTKIYYVSAKGSSQSIPSRLREIDALFAVGGLERSRRKRTTAPAQRKTASSSRAMKSAESASKPAKPVILRATAWKQYPWLVHGFSTRIGGVSTAYCPGQKCGELNLGMTASDSRENVLKNRELFLRALLANGRVAALKAPLAEFVMLRQIHSGLIHHFAAGTPEPPLRGDGSITAEAGNILAIQTADCIPILVADVRQQIVAAFHAGWRGTLARIVERGIGRLRAEFGSRPGDLTATIGPGIGRCCYSVGEEVRMEFTSQFAYADALFEEVFDLDPIKQKYPMLFLTARAPGHSNLGPSIHLDLPEANRRQLLDAGLEAKNIHSLGLCTACDTKRFFSHRAEQGFTGRMLSAIGVVKV